MGEKAMDISSYVEGNKRLIVEIKEDLNATQRIARDISNIAQVLEEEKGSVRGSDLMA